MSDIPAMAAACEAARARLPVLHFLPHDAIWAHLLQTQGADGVRAVLSQVSEAQGVEVNADGSVAAVHANGEALLLEPPVPAAGRESIAVLEDVLRAMSAALKREVKRACGDLKDQLQQVASVVLAAAFSSSVKEALATANPAAALADLRKQQEQTVVGAARGLQRGGQPALQQKRLRNILALALRHADLIADLCAAQDPKAAWAGMLQTEVADDGAVTLRLGDAVLPYGWHFNSADRLALSPEANNAYRAIVAGRSTSAHVTGPAGSGKTETAKQLAYDLGMLPMVYNCSDQCDYLMYENACRGAQGGVMVIFDEFNRSELEHAKKFLDNRAASGGSPSAPWVVCTWNPGYAGRSFNAQLVHGAPVAPLTFPESRHLLRGFLASEGFERYESAATQLSSLFSWAKEHLSKDPLYDWGFRGLKAVVNAAGTALRAKNTEAAALRHALDLSVAPRLAAADRAKWAAEVDRVAGSPANPARQLAALAKHRHGLLAVAAKSETALEGVRAAAAEEGVELVHVDMSDVKGHLSAALFGSFDETTRDWTDGVVNQALRAANEKGGRTWVVVPGEGLGPIEMENMNTVLDDNKTLCLESGERIRLGEQVAFVFVNLDASKQSPATISRLGAVRFD